MDLAMCTACTDLYAGHDRIHPSLPQAGGWDRDLSQRCGKRHSVQSHVMDTHDHAALAQAHLEARYIM